MTLLKICFLLCTACSTSILTDDEVADLVRRVDLLSSRESAGPRIATLTQASALLKTSFPDVSARFAAEARSISAPPSGLAVDRTAVEREVSGPALEAAARTFLRAVESGGENPSDYDWFADVLGDLVRAMPGGDAAVREALEGSSGGRARDYR